MPGSTGRYGNCGIIKNGVQPAQHNEQDTNSADTPANSSRRCFLGSLGSATAMAVVVGIPLGPLLGGKASRAEAAVIPYGSRARAAASFECYRTMATRRDSPILAEIGANALSTTEWVCQTPLPGQAWPMRSEADGFKISKTS